MPHNHNWREALLIYTQPRIAVMTLLGFTAGLPYLLVFSTLSAWLRDAGISRTEIGFLSWIGITYSIKVIWAPIIDKLPLPWLSARMGRRRAWMIFAQIGIMSGLFGMGYSAPGEHLDHITALAIVVAFFSATQDIVIDAYRVESMRREYQGALATTYVLGYRIAVLCAGAGAFYVATYTDWQTTYRIMGGLMWIGIITTLFIPEPACSDTYRQSSSSRPPPSGIKTALKPWLNEAISTPFTEFFRRHGKLTLTILLLVSVYKLSDITMGVMANPFYLDKGFSKTQVADITKIFGFFMTIGGSAIGGILVLRYGLMRPLLCGAAMVMLTNLLFAILAQARPDLWLLAAVVSVDNLSGGIATAVFIAYLSSLTHSAYTATQYALLSSLMTLPAKLIAGFSGIIVDSYGYLVFFVYAAAIGLPAIIIILYLMFVNAYHAPS